MLRLIRPRVPGGGAGDSGLRANPSRTISAWRTLIRWRVRSPTTRRERYARERSRSASSLTSRSSAIISPAPGLVHLLLEVDQFAQDVGGAEFVEPSENVVAERKSWTSRPLKHCDLILVMSVGSVLERGNHEELIAKPCGLYGSLARLPLE